MVLIPRVSYPAFLGEGVPLLSPPSLSSPSSLLSLGFTHLFLHSLLSTTPLHIVAGIAHLSVHTSPLLCQHTECVCTTIVTNRVYAVLCGLSAQHSLLTLNACVCHQSPDPSKHPTCRPHRSATCLSTVLPLPSTVCSETSDEHSYLSSLLSKHNQKNSKLCRACSISSSHPIILRSSH